MTMPKPGGVENEKPVTELALFGVIPRSPAIIVAPVLVMACAAITPKPAAVPSGTVCANTDSEQNANAAAITLANLRVGAQITDGTGVFVEHSARCTA